MHIDVCCWQSEKIQMCVLQVPILVADGFVLFMVVGLYAGGEQVHGL